MKPTVLTFFDDDDNQHIVIIGGPRIEGTKEGVTNVFYPDGESVRTGARTDDLIRQLQACGATMIVWE